MNKRIIGLRSHVARAVTALVMFAALGWGAGQAFDANRYYQQCLRFEASGDLGIAKESCTNAIRANPDFTEAKLAMACVELALGELGSTESRLNRLRNETTSAEPFVLLADLAIQTDRLLEAEAFLATAQNRLTTEFNRELAARTSYLQGVVAEQRGRFSEALTFYEQAVVADSIESKYRLADASLRFKLGNLDGAREQLASYLALSDDIHNAELRELTAGYALSDRASCRGMAHSTDLRERIINAVIHKRYTLQKAADTFDVGAATVSRYLRRYRQTGDLTPRTSPGRPSALNEYQAWVEQSLISNDLTHDQRCDLLFDEIGVRISRATRCRWVQRLGSTRKKDDLRQ